MFAAHGFSAAPLRQVAALAKVNQALLFHYFGSKEGLYLAVLERVYAQIRQVERGIHVEELSPDEALRTLAEATYDHHTTHEAFIQLVSIENINRAEHMAKSPTFPGQNASVLSLIKQILARGREQGRFARAVDALDVHMLISSYCVFRVANRHTFKTIFGRDLTDPALRDRYRTMLGDVVVAYLTELDDDP